MISNYEYFLALAEEGSISKAANKLFVSHQCLSRYLSSLEKRYNVSFFERKPRLTLTPAGKILLDTFRQVQVLEANLYNQLEDIRSSKKGLIRFGTTEGRYRILVPDLVSQFKSEYPDVILQVFYSSTDKLHDMLVDNKLDIALLNRKRFSSNLFDMIPALNERLYMVISDHMLQTYFPDKYPDCRDEFTAGVNLADFTAVPFILNYRGFNSREILENYLDAHGLTLNCVMELTQQDLHFMMTSRDYAASFCFAMYLPTIGQINKANPSNPLHVFPIRGINTFNQMALVTTKGKILPKYGRAMIRMILDKCKTFQ